MTNLLARHLMVGAVALSLVACESAPPVAIVGVPPHLMVVKPLPLNLTHRGDLDDLERELLTSRFPEIRVTGYPHELSDGVPMLKSPVWTDSFSGRRILSTSSPRGSSRLQHDVTFLAGAGRVPGLGELSWVVFDQSRQVRMTIVTYPCSWPGGAEAPVPALPWRCFDLLPNHRQNYRVDHDVDRTKSGATNPASSDDHEPGVPSNHGLRVPSTTWLAPPLRSRLAFGPLIDEWRDYVAETSHTGLFLYPYHPAWRAHVATLPATSVPDDVGPPGAEVYGAFDWVVFWGDGELSIHGADADNEGFLASVWEARTPTATLGVTEFRRWLHCHPYDVATGGTAYQPARLSTETRWYGSEGTLAELWYEADGLREGFHYGFAPDGAPIHVSCYRGGLLHGLVYQYGYRGDPATWTLVAAHIYELGERLGSWEASPEADFMTRGCQVEEVAPDDRSRPEELFWRHRSPWYDRDCAIRVDGRAR